MLGSQTLTPGSTVTAGSGASTALVEVEIAWDGATRVVVENAETLGTFAQPTVTSESMETTTSSDVVTSSVLVVNGHTYTLGPASLDAEATGASTGFATGVYATASGEPDVQTGAALKAASGLLIGGVAAVAFGVAALL